MAIKDSAETWVRGKPLQAMTLVAAVGVVLGGLLGLGAGFKIEQNRTKDDVSKLQQQIKASGVTGLGPIGQRAGKVTSTSAASVTIDTKQQGKQEIKTTANTKIEKAVAAGNSDIVVGARVLLTLNGSDVIVLPKGSRLGRLVLAVSSNEFQIAKANGARGGKIPMKNVKHVSTTSTAALSDIKKDASVLAGGRATSKKAFAAVEVILLEPGSGFAA